MASHKTTKKHVRTVKPISNHNKNAHTNTVQQATDKQTSIKLEEQQSANQRYLTTFPDYYRTAK